MLGKIKKNIKLLIPTFNNNFQNKITPNLEILEKCIIESGISKYINFDYSTSKKITLQFVNEMQINEFEYKYCKSSMLSSLYSTIYAHLIYGLFDEIKTYTKEYKDGLVNYINSFQNENNGLFYDANLNNAYYDDCDWWGARHLNLHIINLFMVLKSKPKYEFKFIFKYYNLEFTDNWLNSFNWDDSFSHDNDIDNKLMNIVIALQFQRDIFEDIQAGETVKYIQNFLYSKINPATGMWGKFDVEDKDDLSRMVQFAYHIFPIFFYDGIIDFQYDKIIDFTLKTQNKYGGFGVKLNSSACEDIDSIDILIKLSNFTEYKKAEINHSLKRAFIFVLANQNDDGGFVFRRDEKFWYGHKEMTSNINESAMFPTWFRTLSIAYLNKYFNLNYYNVVKSPGFF